MAGQTKFAPRRYQVLDTLRGFGAMYVLGYHVLQGYLHTSTHLGVDFFFVISGYLMAMAYFDRPGLDFLKFSWTRFARMYPLHLLTLLFAVFVNFLLQGGIHLGALWKSLLLVHNVGIGPAYLAFNYPSWTISTEFWVNVGVAAIFFLPSKLRYSVLTVLALGSFAVLFVHAETLNVSFAEIAYGLNGGLLRTTGGFIAGVGTYYLGKHWTKPIPDWWKLIAFFSFFAIISSPDELGNYGLFAIPVFCWITLCFTRAPSKVDEVFGRFHYLGDISYSIYLLHVPILLASELIARDVFGISNFDLVRTNPIYFVSIMVGTVILSHYVYQYFEAPIYRNMRKWPDQLKRFDALPK